MTDKPEPQATAEQVVAKLLDLHDRLRAAVQRERPYTPRMRMGDDDISTVLSACIVIETQCAALQSAAPRPEVGDEMVVEPAWMEQAWREYARRYMASKDGRIWPDDLQAIIAVAMSSDTERLREALEQARGRLNYIGDHDLTLMILIEGALHPVSSEGTGVVVGGGDD